MAAPKKEGANKALKQWTIRILTIAISVGLLYYYLRDIDWPSLKAAAGRASLWPALAGIIIPMIGFWIADCALTVGSFRWFHRPVPFKSYFIIKAAGYLLAMINITFATGGVFLYFMRKTGIGVKKQAGLLVWRSVMAAFSFNCFLAVLVAAALVFQPGIADEMKLVYFGPAILFVLLLMAETIAFFWYGRGLLLRWLPVDWKADFWCAFREARLKHWAAGFGYTAPFIVLYFIGMFVVARSFHIEAPFSVFLLRMPLAAIVSALPVAFGGFGTTTAAWAGFFGAYGDKADLAAISIFIPAVRLITRLIIGAIFIPLATTEIEALRKPDCSDQP